MKKSVEIRERIRGHMREYKPGIGEVDKGMRGALIGTLNKYCAIDEIRRLLFGWLFFSAPVEISSKQLSDRHWYALQKWVGLHKDETDGEWRVNVNFPLEIQAIFPEVSRSLLRMKTAMIDADILEEGVSLPGETRIREVSEDEANEIVKKANRTPGTGSVI